MTLMLVETMALSPFLVCSEWPSSNMLKQLNQGSIQHKYAQTTQSRWHSTYGRRVGEQSFSPFGAASVDILRQDESFDTFLARAGKGRGVNWCDSPRGRRNKLQCHKKCPGRAANTDVSNFRPAAVDMPVDMHMASDTCSVTGCSFGLLAASLAGTLRDSCGKRAKHRYERKIDTQYSGILTHVTSYMSTFVYAMCRSNVA